MCGIAGFLGFDSDAKKTIGRMVQAIHHRGPDAQQTWISNSDDIALGHARLSVVDLSEAGAQPMHSHSGRFVLCFNGEVYNHLEIRNSIEKISSAPNWRGSSDSETLVAALDVWGIEKTLRLCTGMFAVAIWDRNEKQLTLARDRFGEKPIYYQPHSSGVIFGSEIVAIERHPACARRVSRSAVAELASKECIAAPRSIYEGVYKLLPGSLVVFNKNGFLSTCEWWSAIDTAIENQNSWQGSDQDAINELERLLEKSINGQMQADVPLGAFLSGGIDSSLIVALMQQNYSESIKTFSIGFSDNTFDESKYAAQVAKHLNTSHTEFHVSEIDICDLVPKLSSIYSEPFANSSQLPTYLVSKLSRQDVTVALTGDAGDEVFGGYNRHIYAARHWPLISKFPIKMRKFVARLINSTEESRLDRIFKGNPLTKNWTRIGERLQRVGHTLPAANISELYRLATNVSDLKHVYEFETCTTNFTDGDYGPQRDLLAAQQQKLLDSIGLIDDIRWMMLQDQIDYLPNDNLVKVDRASMACSLETRTPFLDHNLVEFSQKIPSKLLLHNNRSKYPLRRMLEKHVPLELFERPKMGFSIPMHSMVKNQLKDWAEFHLSSAQLKNSDVFDTQEVQKIWADHSAGKSNNIKELWPVLVYQAWTNEHCAQVS